MPSVDEGDAHVDNGLKKLRQLSVQKILNARFRDAELTFCRTDAALMFGFEMRVSCLC